MNQQHRRTDKVACFGLANTAFMAERAAKWASRRWRTRDPVMADSVGAKRRK
jgi:hypothetical protein